IKIPAAKSGSMVFGSAFHFALQRLFEKMKAGNGTFPLQETMLDDFLWFMQKNRDAFTPEEFVRRIEYGEKIIPEYYQAHIQQWHRNVHIEYNLRNVQLDGIPLNGKIDKIEFFGNNINVVDYKTGKFTNARRKLQPPNDKEPNGGDYWRQAVFYKILIDNNPQQSWQMDGVTFEFVEPNNDQYPTITIQVAAADVTTVSQQIKQVWKKIQNREFHTGCGKPDCEWCNFVKRNELYVHLNYLSEEEENI
ncbi:MAG TPA: PD-(D/E)XK nuclease family protein, partial [Niabella sp.]